MSYLHLFGIELGLNDQISSAPLKINSLSFLGKLLFKLNKKRKWAWGRFIGWRHNKGNETLSASLSVASQTFVRYLINFIFGSAGWIPH